MAAIMQLYEHCRRRSEHLRQRQAFRRQRNLSLKTRLAGCVKTTALGYAALKTGSKCSFTARKLRFLACFFLA
jgi:hypothetical protein